MVSRKPRPPEAHTIGEARIAFESQRIVNYLRTCPFHPQVIDMMDDLGLYEPAVRLCLRRLMGDGVVDRRVIVVDGRTAPGRPYEYFLTEVSGRVAP